MLGIFHRAFAHPPQELQSLAEPVAAGVVGKDEEDHNTKAPDEILRAFHSAHPGSGCFSASFGRGAALAYVPAANRHVPKGGRRMFCAAGDVYCLLHGSVDNFGALARQYGITGAGRRCNDAALVIEAYRALRDSGPGPAVRDLKGAFAFVVYDAATGAVFAALSSDGAIPLYWGIARDGSAVISDELDTVKVGCGKSFAPFPSGCMFHSNGGLRSFEHPADNMGAVPRVDSDGATSTRLPQLPVPRGGCAADRAGA